jgi:hypothetical protein
MGAVGFQRVAVVMWFTATACACAPADSSGARNLRTFRSRTYRYAIDHPANWSTIEATRELDDGEPPATAGGGTDILARNADTKVSNVKLPAMVVGAQRVSSATDIDRWTAMVIGTVSFMKQCSRPDARKRIEVRGEQAVLLVYNDCPKGSGLFHLWTAVVHRGFGFHIVWFDRHGREVVDRERLDVMLSSVTFAG